MYTNDLPETIHNHEPANVAKSLFNLPCSDCGGICCFADDSTFSISANDEEELNAKINCKYKEIADYMNGNRLLLNSDKTHFIIISAKKNTNQVILLNTGSEIMEPSDSERLLGLQVSGHLTWNEHICNGDKSLVKTLSVRINCLRKVCVWADFKTRKMLANGIVHSKLVYMIQLYGQASDYFIKMLQVQQNRAARTVTRLEWNTRTKVLLQQVGWLSVRQLFAYHSLCLVRKIEFSSQPLFLKEKLKENICL